MSLRVADEKLAMMKHAPAFLDPPSAASDVRELIDDHRDARDRIKRMEAALRHISATADTLSPQEFINVCADALGLDRHEYAGECNPNRSLVEARIAIRIACDGLRGFFPPGETTP